MDPNITGNQTDDSNVILETLVGEGKKYKTVADLAKAYAHADVHIAKITAENAEKEERMKTMEAQLEILNKLATNQTNTPSAQSNNTPAVETPGDKKLENDNIEAKIRSTVEQLSEEQKRTANTQKVDAVLIEKFGEAEKATDFLKNKATELGLGVKFLTDLAASSPTAFFATVGIDTTTQPKSDPAPKNTVNTAALQGTAPKPNTYAWYQQLRRDNKALYNSAKIQLQMHQDASKPGFFD